MTDGETATDRTVATGGHPVVLFDGVCNLCSGVVTVLLPRDEAGVLRFASLQSDAGKSLLEGVGLPADARDTIVLVEGDDYYTKSTAVLRIARHLGGVYRLAWWLRVVPRPVRDAVYDVVAANRYEWFGKKDHCMVPPPDATERFLEDD